MTEQDFYFRREQQDFIFQGSNLFRKVNGKEISLFNFEGNYQEDDFLVLQVLNYQQFFVILLSWKLDRNLICIDGDKNQVVWRIPPAKQTSTIEENFWTEIFIKEELPDVVYCRSIKRYLAAFKIETGEMVYEKTFKHPDPRDF